MLVSSLNYFLGVAIDVVTGKWVGRQSGLGAGVDSYFEYLLKVRKQIARMCEL